MCWIHHIKLERYVLDTPHKDIEVCAGYTKKDTEVCAGYTKKDTEVCAGYNT
jgi:hypothetical protein